MRDARWVWMSVGLVWVSVGLLTLPALAEGEELLGRIKSKPIGTRSMSIEATSIQARPMTAVSHALNTTPNGGSNLVAVGSHSARVARLAALSGAVGNRTMTIDQARALYQHAVAKKQVTATTPVAHPAVGAVRPTDPLAAHLRDRVANASAQLATRLGNAVTNGGMRPEQARSIYNRRTEDFRRRAVRYYNSQQH